MTEEQARAILAAGTTNLPPLEIGQQPSTPFAQQVGTQVPVPSFGADQIAQARAAEAAPAIEKADFVRRNALPGVPIDLDQEISPWLKFRTATLPTMEDKLSYLNKELREANPDFYGASMPARPSDTGEILVRIPGPEGKPMEIPLNKPGVTPSDIGTLAAHLPAAIAGLAGAIYAKKLPLGERLPKTAASFYSAIAGAGAETLEDIAARTTGGLPARPVEAAERRALEVPISLAMDAGFAGLRAAGKRIISPFAEPSAERDALKAASDYFKADVGKPFPMTVGEITQSPLVLRTEATMGRLPGSSPQIEAYKKAKTEYFEDVQKNIIGAERAALPSEQAVGERAVRALKAQLEPIQSSIKSQREGLFDALSRRLEQTMDEVTGEPRQVFAERVGAGVRAKAQSMWQSLQDWASTQYEALYKLPGGSDRILSAPNAAQAAESALKNLPGYTKGTQQATFETVLPPKAISVLEELADTKGAQMSLRDLIGARSALDDVIAKERGGLPDVKLRELINARKLFTNAIEEAAASSPDKTMLPTWKAINKQYADEAKKFDPSAIQKLFVKSDKPGHILDEDIVKALKPSEYVQFKEFLGSTSPEFRTLKRSIVDQLMAGSRQPGGRIEGKDFLNDLFKLREQKRAIFDDIFPAAVEERARQLGQSLVDLGSKTPIKAIREALTSEEPAMISRLRQLEVQENKLAAKYRSDILKQIGEGKLDPSSFDAGKFVDLVYSNSNVRPEHVAKLMSELSGNPEVQQLLRQKVTEKIFYDAQRLIKNVDPARHGVGETLRPANSAALDRVLGDEENRKKLAVVLGSKTMEDIRQLGKLIRSGELTEETFSSAGALAGGMFVAGMITHGPLKYSLDWVKQKFAAIMITSPILKQYAQNLAVTKTPLRQVFSDETAQAVIGSVPFQQALIKEYGKPGAAEITQNMLNSGEKYQQEPKPKSTPKEREEKFRNLLGPQP